ncbi:hypothetical protein IWW34DRAFT_895111 [Fusarium oxysporum f. sp. albedinis]|nr:hypothetical protein IWW34DRAFT_895111 [Fusarium oxysporum f. sp. albedinis]
MQELRLQRVERGLHAAGSQTSRNESNTEGRSQEDSDAAVSAKDEARLAERIGERSSESTIIRKTNSRIKQLDYCLDPTKYQTSIHYLNILTQVEGDRKYKSQQSDNLTKNDNAGPISAYVFNHGSGRSIVAARQVDPVDYAFLLEKGVFDLPPQHCMQVSILNAPLSIIHYRKRHSEAILRAYFEFMYLFAPILDRIAFLRSCLLIAKLGFSFEVRLVNESLDWDRDTHIVPFWEQSAFEVQFKPRRGKGCPTIVFGRY